jgi:hypothetical protein
MALERICCVKNSNVRMYLPVKAFAAPGTDAT